MRRREIVVAFLITRLALVIASLIALKTLPSVTGPEYRHASDQPLIDLWYRWDAGYFTRIALHGYGWMQGQRSSDATFMPLYPLLISWPLRFLNQPSIAAAVIVGVTLSNVCWLLALFVFDALMIMDNVAARQRRLAIWLFLLAPAAIFFSGVYTESLFLLLSLIAVYAARRDRWVIASAAGVLAASTRVVGLTISALLIAEVWRQREHKRWPIKQLVAATLPIAALPLYAIIVGRALGSPFAYFEITQSVWGQGLGTPWQAISDFFSGPITLYGWQRSLIDPMFTVCSLVLVLPTYRLRRSYGFYQLIATLVPVLAGTFVSMPRYVAVLFPTYLVLAQWATGHQRRTVRLLIVFAALEALFAARFVTWHWIA